MVSYYNLVLGKGVHTRLDPKELGKQRPIQNFGELSIVKTECSAFNIIELPPMLLIKREKASLQVQSLRFESPLPYFAQNTDAAIRLLDSDSQGLSRQEAEIRLNNFGRNELKEARRISMLGIFFGQFKSLVMIILIVATLISRLLGEWIDALVILTILFLIGVFGFLQEFKAEQAMQALRRLATPKAVVVRDGKRIDIDARYLVPGDILLLESGNIVPADARLLEAVNLHVEEAALTGESESVKKQTEVVALNSVLAERTNMVFSGTIVTQGRGRAVVAATGMKTEIGRIAALIQETPQEMTPLQIKLDRLGRTLGALTIAICLVVFGAELFKNEKAVSRLLALDFPGFFRAAKEGFLVSVALAVAAIPEGLPAVVTISLALGTRRMLGRNALVRRLSSVETLGETTVICSDKTGTLTMNQMTVERLFLHNRVLTVSGSGYDTLGQITESGEPVPREVVGKLLTAGVLNNDAELREGGLIGDPTEGALLVSAAKAGLDKKALEITYPRVDEIGFTSERKMMTTVHAAREERLVYSKGAPETILACCSFIEEEEGVRPLNEQDRSDILDATRNFSAEGLRVLAFAYKSDAHAPYEEKLIFLGLQAMRDPPRPEVPAAIRQCRAAGIQVVMITGDHVVTACAIGKAIGLEGKALTGHELDEIEDLAGIAEEVAIYARVNPEHKLKIVDTLRQKGHHIVAMTGDGVNDAPALKKSDIGVAMGISGTDVSREASDVVLTDDNFASIVSAVEEGRKIYDNIKNYVQYLLSSNIAEVLIIFLAILLGLPIPLLAIQILLMNLVTDGAPAIALSLEPGEKDIMQRRPRDPDEAILSSFMAIKMIVLAVAMTAVTLGVYMYYLDRTCADCPDPLAYPRTLAFTTLVMLEMFNVLNSKSDRQSLWKTGLFNNLWLWMAIASSLIIQIAVVQWTPYEFFNTVPLTGRDWLVSLLLGSSALAAGEGLKWCYRLGERKRKTADDYKIQ